MRLLRGGVRGDAGEQQSGDAGGLELMEQRRLPIDVFVDAYTSPAALTTRQGHACFSDACQFGSLGGSCGLKPKVRSKRLA